MNFLELKLIDKHAHQGSPAPEEERVKNSLDYIADIFEENLTPADDDPPRKEAISLDIDTSSEGTSQVDYGLPLGLEPSSGGQLSPNAFARGIENMENRDYIPMPSNSVNVVKNPLGWLWLGGIQGVGTDIAAATAKAMQDLEGEERRNSDEIILHLFRSQF